IGGQQHSTSPSGPPAAAAPVPMRRRPSSRPSRTRWRATDAVTFDLDVPSGHSIWARLRRFDASAVEAAERVETRVPTGDRAGRGRAVLVQRPVLDARLLG